MKTDRFPDQGMYFEHGRSKARSFAKRGDYRLVNSVINQVKLHEGKDAAKELTKEISMDFNKGQ